MTEDEFAAYLMTFLWRPGDTVLEGAIPSLSLMAENELNRRLNINRRTTALMPIEVTAEATALPVDFRQMLYIGSELDTQRRRGFKNVTQYGLNSVGQPSDGVLPMYHTSGGMLYTRASSYPQTLVIQYRTNVPAMSDPNKDTWLIDDFLDLYTYTVLKHAGPFLREDDRIPIWTTYAEAALTSALEEDTWEVEFGGSPLELFVERQMP